MSRRPCQCQYLDERPCSRSAQTFRLSLGVRVSALSRWGPDRHSTFLAWISLFEAAETFGEVLSDSASCLYVLIVSLPWSWVLREQDFLQPFLSSTSLITKTAGKLHAMELKSLSQSFDELVLVSSTSEALQQGFFSRPGATLAFFKFILIFTHLCQGPPSGLFASCFRARILYGFLTLTMRTRLRPFNIWFEHRSNIWWRAQSMKLLIMQFFSVFCYFLTLWLNSHFCALFPSTLSCILPLVARPSFRQPYNPHVLL
jgi:hypothetical protein